MTVNFADAEWHHDTVNADTDDDRPALGDVVDFYEHCPCGRVYVAVGRCDHGRAG